MTKLATIGRPVEEWVGSSPTAEIPRLVKARIMERQNGLCAITGKKLGVGEVEFDHKVPLRDGGDHREGNLQAVWNKAHREKTAAEATDRAKERRIHAKHFGYAPPSPHKIRSRGFQKRLAP